jgi:hypothetical protein
MNILTRIVLVPALAAVVLLPTPPLAKQMRSTDTPAIASAESKEEDAAHAEGRAVDINEVDGLAIGLAVDPLATPKQREAMRGYLRELEASARSNPEVELFMSPIGGFARDTVTKRIVREATKQEMEAHRTHIHMTIMR